MAKGRYHFVATWKTTMCNTQDSINIEYSKPLKYNKGPRYLN